MSLNKPGKFITLEGIEGAGKSTVMPLLQKVLKSAKIDFIATREPGGTILAEKIRTVFLEPCGEELDPVTELLLVFAGRNQHVKQLIAPALAAGKWVISDRFTDATYAYQGGGRGMSTEKISMVEQFVLGDFHPDHVLLLDIPVEIARERILIRKSLDRIEQETLDFFERIRQSYLQRAKLFPERYTVIDAACAIEDVSQQVVQAMTRWVTA